MQITDQLKDLWKRCFGDPDSFIDLYFKHRHSADNTDVLIRDGKVVAQLQRIAYPIQYHSLILGGDYLSGVCTDADFRNQGLMSELLLETHRKSFENGQTLTFLIPAEEWLKGYYARFGYTTCFYTRKKRVSAGWVSEHLHLPQLQLKAVSLHGMPDDETYLFFESMLRRYPISVLHTLTDWQVIAADLALAGGEIWMGMRDGEPVALAFMVAGQGVCTVKELLAVDERFHRSMMVALVEQTSMACNEWTFPSVLGEVQELGMARVVNVKQALDIYARVHPDETCVIRLADDSLIPENKGCYRVADGQCERLDIVPGGSLTMDIPAFTRWLLSEKPHMSLMLN